MMTRVESAIYHHPALVAGLICIPVGLLVAWLTGDFSPVEAIRHIGGF